MFRVKSGFYRSTGGYQNPQGVIGPIWAIREKRRAGQGRPRAPSPLGPNWTREGGRHPPFLLPLPSFLSYSNLGRRGILLPVGGLLQTHP